MAGHKRSTRSWEEGPAPISSLTKRERDEAAVLIVFFKRVSEIKNSGVEWSAWVLPEKFMKAILGTHRRRLSGETEKEGLEKTTRLEESSNEIVLEGIMGNQVLLRSC